MPPVDRKNPKRAASSESKYSLIEFAREFSDDDACLEWLWRERYSPDGEHAHCPRCDKQRSFKKYATKQQRQSWSCTACGLHVHPTAGTIFHKSSTSLQHWFYAMFLVSSSRCGVAAKQLERELGCNYKTAWRMLNLIRNKLMDQEYVGPLSGDVEVDETWVGGKLRESEKRKLRAEQEAGKRPRYGPYVKQRPMVLGMVERKGKIRAEVVPERWGYTLRSNVRKFVLPTSMVFTDDYYGYHGLDRMYHHRRINHSERVFVSGDVHSHTIEGFFGHFKSVVRGTHHSISA
jgi:transposase